jgi:carboxymethylenebutenolidase
MPQGPGPFPAILVVHEIFGVHEYIQDICRRLAKQGYLAIAPSLYFRQGDVTRMKDIQQIMSQIVSKVPQEQVMSDLDATLDWLNKFSNCDTSRTGIVGFCWGGNVTWMYSNHNSNIKAGVAWYGPLSGEAVLNRPSKNPIQIATTLKVPVLGLYGGKDTRISNKDIKQMRKQLKKGKSNSKIIVYPKADHGFHADYRASYNQKAASDGWKKMLDWFKNHGVSSR